MKNKLKNGIALSLVPQIVLVKWLGSYPEIIEAYYSQGVYPFVSGFFRFLFGWVSFSIGDIIYICLGLLAIKYVVTKRKYILSKPLIFFRNIFVVLAVAYFTFHLMWGFNYYRQPISKTLSLTELKEQTALIEFTEKLIIATNTQQVAINNDSTKSVQIPYSKKEIFQKTLEGYSDLKKEYPELDYLKPSLKTSLFSTLLTYMGYGGYLNPFTNEAQVNGKIPKIRLPVVAGHEIGHQLGYSAENETNFVGYLVTLNNKDPYFRYSALSYGLSYCLSDIKRKDAAQFKALYAKVNRGVKNNYKEITEFWMGYENPLEPVFKSAFSTFLKANSQKKGIDSYNLVVSLLVAYHNERPLQDEP
ncbi:DUF3810 domain-containing protein [Muriicola sp. Z0-33]|uniref:DUF3810 domain-containing protein n=1 Tax=Muriicola sp. Z0-33 TaxID=2816957 RepID=UPI002237C486|nr:DUF3810 domain-containing protein [Muriicola sp. Z0-33]MCW5515836.1 DUF3810 domain-containing protein [Muriicola sp. Z0-33]